MSRSWRASLPAASTSLQRAGVSLLGGHTVQDQEIKFGYAVTGEIHPRRIWTNAGARAGDVLFLTKPLGTGIIATALKAGRAPDAAVAAAIAVDVPAEPCRQRSAASAAGRCRARLHRCHRFRPGRPRLRDRGRQQVTLEIESAAVPVIEGALALASGNIPGGGRTNADHFRALASMCGPASRRHRSRCSTTRRRRAGCSSRSTRRTRDAAQSGAGSGWNRRPAGSAGSTRAGVGFRLIAATQL